jgi:2-succinyl-5-enolpyruvyl-6-hydroxy-3-cyclohexene-1-carboxylate synthase
VRALNRNLAWCFALAEELARAGVRHAVVSPGSRSAPLALAFASEPAIRDHARLDERAAAFFALGLARATRTPVALVCTSGTAAANYLPALVEAHHSRVPLIALTADRPPELRDCGAGQVIDQVKLYAGVVRWYHELPLPEPSDALLRHVRAAGARAVASALGGIPGPVHLNVPLREPLDATEVAADREALAALAPLARAGRASAPLTRAAAPAPARLQAAELDALAARLAATERGWLVAGPCDAPELAPALSELAERLSWPLLAEPLSQLRCGPHARGALVDAHDAVLRCAELAAPRLRLPELVLRFGAPPTSKAYRLLLERHPAIAQLSVDPHGWSDPSALAVELLRSDPVQLARDLAARLDARPRAGFARDWIEAGRRARAALDARLDQLESLSEPGALRALAEAVPDGTTVFLASSLPVREADLFWPPGARHLRFVANRGANGIDGTFSCALGTAAAGAPTVLVCGDLALLHDASGWVGAAQSGIDLVAVVLDNDGGGIFELLPAARSIPREIFERHLAAPHGLDLLPALRGFGLRAQRVTRAKQLADELRAALARPGIDVLVVPGDRRANAALHAELMSSVASALGGGS